jgi:predicted glycoside hydrolase/deacetylase ChbG (UPF0249 family)
LTAPLHLIVRADDAGSARAVNLAIAETALHGVVRNVSVMANGPELAHAADTLPRLPGVVFGLHCTLNSEWTTGPRWRPVLPASSVPSLVEGDGAFTASPTVLHERGFDLAEAEAELRAQLARLRALGFDVRYLDSHMRFEWITGLDALLDRIAASEGLVCDHPHAEHPRLPGHPGTLVERIADAPTDRRLVLVTHPALVSPETAAFASPRHEPGQVAARRDAERRALRDPALRDLVAQGRLVLETYAPPAHPPRAPSPDSPPIRGSVPIRGSSSAPARG